jgi:hypothetical protein
MSVNLPSTFYGAGYVACAVLFYGAFIGDVENNFRIAGIFMGVLLFIILTAVYAWDRNEYYQRALRI